MSGSKRAVAVAVVLVILIAGAAIVFATFGHHLKVGRTESPQVMPPAAQAPAGEREVEDAPVVEPGYQLSGTVENGVRVVTMKARRFEFDPGKVVVMAGEQVRLEVTSEDVKHGIDIETLGVNRALEPGKTEMIDLKIDKPGTYPFRCSVYCGPGHKDMHGELIVLGLMK